MRPCGRNQKTPCWTGGAWWAAPCDGGSRSARAGGRGRPGVSFRIRAARATRAGGSAAFQIGQVFCISGGFCLFTSTRAGTERALLDEHKERFPDGWPSLELAACKTLAGTKQAGPCSCSAFAVDQRVRSSVQRKTRLCCRGTGASKRKATARSRTNVQGPLEVVLFTPAAATPRRRRRALRTAPQTHHRHHNYKEA